MVHGHHEYMRFLRQLQEAGAEQAAIRQDKGGFCFLCDQFIQSDGPRFRCQMIELQDGDIECAISESQLRHAVFRCEITAQCLMPFHQAAQGVDERRLMQRAVELYGDCHVVVGALSLQLIEKPETRLRVRQRHFLIRHRCNGRQRRAKRCVSICAAMYSMVGFWNSTCKGSSTKKISLMRETTCMASSECPPNAKKSLLTLTESSFRISHQISLNRAS